MKHALVLALTCVLGLGLATFAGPVVGINLEPLPGERAGFSFGWEFTDWVAVVNKEVDFSTWTGPFSLLAAWTPNMGTYELRVGPQLNLKLDTAGLKYKGLAFILGVQKAWDMVNFYGQMEIGSTYNLIPRFGFEIEFALPQVQTE